MWSILIPFLAAFFLVAPDGSPKPEKINTGPQFRLPLYSALRADSSYGAMYVSASRPGRLFHLGFDVTRPGGKRFAFGVLAANKKIDGRGSVADEMGFECGVGTVNLDKYGRLTFLAGLISKKHEYARRAAKDASSKDGIKILLGGRYDWRGIYFQATPWSSDLAPFIIGFEIVRQ